MSFRSIALALLGCLMGSFAGQALAVDSTAAQAYPQNPIRIVVGVTPGGAADLVARTVAAEISKELHQSVYVENRPGATGAIATSLVARAAPDGYTLLLASTATHGNGVYFSHDHSYDAFKDFDPVGGIAEFPLIMAVSAKLPVHTLQEVVALARKQSSSLTFASSGAGSTPHLAGELFDIETKAKMLHVPYKGSGPAAADLAAGRVDVMFDGVPSLLPFIQSGKVRPVAALGSGRNSRLPDIPTFAEAGYPAMVVSLWFGLMAPHGTPGSVIQQLNESLNKALALPAVRAKLEASGANLIGGSPEDFGTFVRKDYMRWGDVITRAGIHTTE
jgi:tripartite-type tricarboxylate transporter receptor subunit TctC